MVLLDLSATGEENLSSIRRDGGLTQLSRLW